MRHVAQSALLSIIAILCLAASATAGAPEPRIVTNSWQLDVKYGHPRMICVMDENNSPQYFWYLTYTITNNSGEDRLFIPAFTVLTDRGSVIEPNRKVGPLIVKAIQKEQRNPLLEGPVQVIGQLLQGADNAKDSMIVWPVPVEDTNSIKLFIEGLSGEQAVVLPPDSDKPVTLRKALQLEWETPGSREQLLAKPIEFVKQIWVMR
ncbi:MAG: hypothetical protein WC058_14680 [Phycisphaeraceae bacterium]